jgi:predicted nucleic acid-binding protein
MRFWDSSAIVPLLVDEEETDPLLELYPDAEVVAWWGTEVECASAVARLERLGSLEAGDASESFRRLRVLAASWHLVEPTDLVKETAKRLLRTHDLHAADSLQLAAAVVIAEQRPATLEIVCRDRRLALAAEREGFPIL